MCGFNSPGVLEIMCACDGAMNTAFTVGGCDPAVSNVLCACDWGIGEIFKWLCIKSDCFNKYNDICWVFFYSNYIPPGLFKLIPLFSHGKFQSTQNFATLV